ncbi:MAG TPA: hypothetical protein VF147_08600, partial [Vicinamibacterales bacterium]
VLGGGAAIVADRAALGIRRREAAERGAILASIRNTHRIVIAGLAVVVVSGALLLAADSEALLRSWIFWTKMALMVLLLVNGALVGVAERRASAGSAPAWNWIAWTAAASLTLWTLTTLAGAALPNAG